jgi:DNA-binding NarL/FixJ family response regulator
MTFEGLLTISEERIVDLISRGETCVGVADTLHLTLTEVERELSVIFRKLRVSSRLELILYEHSRRQELHRKGNAA